MSGRRAGCLSSLTAPVIVLALLIKRSACQPVKTPVVKRLLSNHPCITCCLPVPLLCSIAAGTAEVTVWALRAEVCVVRGSGTSTNALPATSRSRRFVVNAQYSWICGCTYRNVVVWFSQPRERGRHSKRLHPARSLRLCP